MRRFVALAFAAALVPVCAGVLTAQQPAPPEATISLEHARAAALARVPGNEGVTSTKLKTRHGIQVYEFDIETPGPGHQEVRVNAHTGAVVSSTHEDDLIGAGAAKVDRAADKTGDVAKRTGENAVGAAKETGKAVGGAAKTAGKAVAGAAKSVAGKADDVIRGDDVRKVHPAISEARARTIARRAVPNAPIKDVDLERENGILVWALDMDTAGKGHVEVLVDATTGKVLRQERED